MLKMKVKNKSSVFIVQKYKIDFIYFNKKRLLILLFMEELTLTTPAVLFSAISLIMLAYTNRFLAYAAVIRNLHDKYLEKKDDSLLRQIKNLKLRLNLTRWMQIFGISSLLFCVLTMFIIYIDYQTIAEYVFGFALILLIISLSLLIKEIQISAEALQHHIADIEEHLTKK